MCMYGVMVLWCMCSAYVQVDGGWCMVDCVWSLICIVRVRVSAGVKVRVS